MPLPDVLHIAVPTKDRREGSAALNIPGTGTQFLDAGIVEQSLATISGVLDDRLDDSDQHVLVDNFVSVKDPMLEIARGNVSGVIHVNKFGRSTNVDDGVVTDVYDRANATDDVDIWVAPTQARIHQIKSNTNDDIASTGVGARTMRVYGLTSWDVAEVNEDIILNGITNVSTSNSYVIIHRMEILTKGITSVNVGIITATADVDNTVTAQINIGEGKTQMAIYGFPSILTVYMTGFYASVLKANLATNEQHVDIQLRFNPEPDVELLNFQIKHSSMAGTRANSPFRHDYKPYNKFSGPGILKIQAIGSANNLDVSAGFDLILVNN